MLYLAPAMKRSDFHYDLPDALIAQYPLAERAASRLLHQLRAPLTIIVGPITRPSMAALAARMRDELSGVEGAHIEEREITLASRSLDEGRSPTAREDERLHSAGVHRVLLIHRQPACTMRA